LRDIGVPIEMPIPPIPAVILSRCGSPNQILPESLALRDEFT
jgi:hypothetical protein